MSPTATGDGFAFGPRVLMRATDIAATGLLDLRQPVPRELPRAAAGILGHPNAATAAAGAPRHRLDADRPDERRGGDAAVRRAARPVPDARRADRARRRRGRASATALPPILRQGHDDRRAEDSGEYFVPCTSTRLSFGN